MVKKIYKKTCPVCKEVFEAAKSNIVYCPGKCAALSWVIKNKERHKRHALKYNYGISLEDVERMIIQQDSKCALCLKDISTTIKTCVDHNHKTGAIRGILCYSCNSGLGLFKEDHAILRLAIAYLEK
jgi:hypothetical protein